MLPKSQSFLPRLRLYRPLSLRAFSTGSTNPNVNYTPDPQTREKDRRSAERSSKAEDNMRGKHERVHAVENAEKGRAYDVQSENAKRGLNQAKQDDGMPATKATPENISESAPRPIIGLTEERGGFQRSDGGFTKQSPGGRK
ncbi:hypothetical protein HK104_009241 [Borealophlyctis nickersoniae]|nr:hypothetical protein HK104_009241 [Borealophlyctis nickersoniae]